MSAPEGSHASAKTLMPPGGDTVEVPERQKAEALFLANLEWVERSVASSVLESLSLGTPVVGSENGSRPPGVITYPATDVETLATVLLDVLSRRDTIAAAMPRPELRDTLADEIALLTR